MLQTRFFFVLFSHNCICCLLFGYVVPFLSGQESLDNFNTDKS